MYKTSPSAFLKCQAEPIYFSASSPDPLKQCKPTPLTTSEFYSLFYSKCTILSALYTLKHYSYLASFRLIHIEHKLPGSVARQMPSISLHPQIHSYHATYTQHYQCELHALLKNSTCILSSTFHTLSDIPLNP